MTGKKWTFTGCVFLVAVCHSNSLAQFQFDHSIQLHLPKLVLGGCDVSADGRFLVVGGDRLRVFHAQSRELLQEITPCLRPRYPEPVMVPGNVFGEYLKSIGGFPRWTNYVACSPADPSLFASADSDDRIRIWRVSGKTPVQVFDQQKTRCDGLVFSADGKYLAATASRFKRSKKMAEIRVWDLATSELVYEKLLYNQTVSAASFNSNGEKLVFCRHDAEDFSTLEFVSVSTWEHSNDVRLNDGHAQSILFVPESDRIVVAGGKCVPLGGGGCMPTGRLWIGKVGELDEIKPIDGTPHAYFSSARFSNDCSEFYVRTQNQGRNLLQCRSSVDATVRKEWELGAKGAFQGLSVCEEAGLVAAAYSDELRWLPLDSSTKSIWKVR